MEYVNLDDQSVQEVVLAPTRELAQQIADELTNLAHFIKGLKIAVIYGGQPFSKQMSALNRKPQILVATPGRLLDHMQRGNIRLGSVHTMVLDEADEMLKMGFVQDVERIIESADPNRQLVMFSATTNQDVLTVSWKYRESPLKSLFKRRLRISRTLHSILSNPIRSRNMNICYTCSIRIDINVP